MLLTPRCQLLAPCSAQKLQTALETQQQAKDDKKRRFVKDPQLPNAQATDGAVDELVNEGLQATLLEEVHGSHFCQQPKLAGVGTRERLVLDGTVKMAKKMHSWEAGLRQQPAGAPCCSGSGEKHTQMGVLVVLKQLYTGDAVRENRALEQATTSVFKTEVCGDSDAAGGDFVQLLVSMLRRQLHVEARKTLDTKLPQRRQRLDGSSASDLKLHAAHSIYSVSLRRRRALRLDGTNCTRGGTGTNDSAMSSSSVDFTSVPLIARLVTGFDQ
ncbi:hypothetical protein PRNP1_009383 [Phytophthora ramorum]